MSQEKSQEKSRGCPPGGWKKRKMDEEESEAVVEVVASKDLHKAMYDDKVEAFKARKMKRAQDKGRLSKAYNRLMVCYTHPTHTVMTHRRA